MPCLFTGFFTVVYTIFVCFDVLLKADQDWGSIFYSIFLPWIGVYLLKRIWDQSSPPTQRCKDLIPKSLIVVDFAARYAKLKLLNLARQEDASSNAVTEVCVFSATTMLAAYFLLIRKSAKECEWDNKTSWIYESVQYFLAGFHLFFLYLRLIDDSVKTTDRTTFIIHQVILYIICYSTSFGLCAIMMGNLKLKEEQRPTRIQCPVVHLPKIPCLFIGFSAVFYTIFVCYDVLLKTDQNWNSITYHFSLACIMTYLMKRMYDRSPYESELDQHRDWIGKGLAMINFAAFDVKYKLLDLARQEDASSHLATEYCVFYATTMLVAYFLFIKDSAKECEWDNQTSWIYKSIQGFFAGIYLFFLYLSLVDEEVKTTNRTIFILHQVILSIICYPCSIGVCAIFMGHLKLKEEPVERAAPIENPAGYAVRRRRFSI